MIPLRSERQITITPIATYTIIALNVFSWIVFQDSGQNPGFTRSLCEHALWPNLWWENNNINIIEDCKQALSLSYSLDTSWVALITSTFLHGSWLHLIGNMWFLLFFGRHVEDEIGSPQFFLLYLAGAVLASYAQVIVDSDSTIPILGASGAIAGVMGTYLVLFPKVRVLQLFPVHLIPIPIKSPAWFLVGGWFLCQLLGSMLELLGREGEIAYGAHAGGFVTGFALGCSVRILGRPLTTALNVIGIDLGMTDSCTAFMLDGDVRIIENSEGGRVTPTVVAYTTDGETLTGENAKRHVVSDTHITLSGTKRLIGLDFSCVEAHPDKFRVSYQLGEATENGSVQIETKHGIFAPQKILAEVLTKIKTDAEEYLHGKVSEAVITVPACFNHSQREAIEDACKIATLDIRNVIDDCYAAALSYATVEQCDSATVAVYDLGGGTFDISIITIDKADGEHRLKILAKGGDPLLGGEDFSMCIVDYLCDEFKQQKGIKLPIADPVVLSRLKEVAEQAKIELSTSCQFEDELRHIMECQTTGPMNLTVKITRDKLEKLVKPLVDSTIEICRMTLQDAEFEAKDIDDIILIGSQTRMPLIQHRVQELFGKKRWQHVNFKEVVAMGAAIAVSHSMD